MQNLQARRQNVPWEVRDILYAGLMAGGLIAALVGGFVLFAMLMGWEGPMSQPGHFVVVAMGALEGFMILPAWWWGPGKYGGGWRLLGLRRPPVMRSVVWGSLGLLVILGIDVAWAWVMERFNLPGQPDIVPIFGEGPFGFLAALFVAGVMAPLAEEIFFRGFIYAGLKKAWGPLGGLVASSVLFSVVHLTPGVMVPIACMGAVFALLYEVTDSLWPPITLHALMNIIAVIGVYAFQPSPMAS